MSPRSIIIAGLLTGLVLGAVPVSAAPPDVVQAARYFQEARMLWRKDAGRLWGVSLEGPLLFVDPQTRTVAADRADEEGKLRPESTVFTGQLPPSEPAANTSLRWAGVEWIEIVWPPPRDPTDRAVLMMHESWHRVQRELGFPPADPPNRHLDTLEGRFWLQLELRALADALGRRGPALRASVEDALLFRAYRRSLFKGAAEQERALEMSEGLAEYTGVRLCGLTEEERRACAAAKLRERPREISSFVRSFAYLTGSAYGLLLDGADLNWRHGLTPADDLGLRLQNALKITPAAPTKTDGEARAKKYQADRLRAVEVQRDRARQKQLAEYRARFVDGPALVLPLRDMKMQLDPHGVIPLDESGTVYPTLQISDRWGTLTASRGAFINTKMTELRVVAPTDPNSRPLKGDGWELDVKAGWRPEPGPRKGDYTLSRTKP